MTDSLFLCRASVAALLLALLAAAPARADIFATFDTGPFGPDIFTVNVTTGVHEATPPFVDEPNDVEFHPSLSPDGQFLVVERRDAETESTRRVVMVRRATGQSADLFNAFEASADPPTTPTFSEDGTKVITGRQLERRDPGSPPGALQASFTHTDVTNFPGGPFPREVVSAGGLDSTSPGRTLQPTPAGAAGFAFGIDYGSGGPPDRITVQQPNGATTLLSSDTHFANPAISQSAGVVVYESAPAVAVPRTKLVFRPLAGIETAPTTTLPAFINTPNTHRVWSPTFSRDGRYLAFARSPTGDASRVFVWDTQTQLLLRADGVDAAFGPDQLIGGMALEVRPVLRSALVTRAAVSFGLVQNSAVGIIVQRIVGSTRVLGRRAPKLKFVGRVPLGTFKRGRRHRVRWGGRVAGRRLRRGRYLVTVRSVTRRGQVRDLAEPVRVRIR
jgi:hypothetical protein